MPEKSLETEYFNKNGGKKTRKIRLAGEHMNLQPSAPISGQKIRKIRVFRFRPDPKIY
jgi:hypothetical protein